MSESAGQHSGWLLDTEVRGEGEVQGDLGVVMYCQPSTSMIIMMRMCAPGEAGLGLVDGYAVGGLLGGGEGGAQPAQRALTPA